MKITFSSSSIQRNPQSVSRICMVSLIAISLILMAEFLPDIPFLVSYSLYGFGGLCLAVALLKFFSPCKIKPLNKKKKPGSQPPPEMPSVKFKISPPRNFNCFRFTQKVFENPTEKTIPSISLSIPLVNFLGSVPELKKIMVARGQMTAYKSIFSIYNEGLDLGPKIDIKKQMENIVSYILTMEDNHELLCLVLNLQDNLSSLISGDIGKQMAAIFSYISTLEKPKQKAKLLSLLQDLEKGVTGLVSKIETRKQMQFIIAHIATMEKPKQKEELLSLADDLMDCGPVSQGNLGNRVQRYLGIDAFTVQLQYFVWREKEKAIDQTIFALWPEMQKSNYAARASARNQFPHVKSGCLVLCGETLGLNPYLIKAAKNDKDKNLAWAESKKGLFFKEFEKRFCVQNLVKEFLIQLNGDHNGDIINADGFKWLGQNGMICFFNEETPYPDYSPRPNTGQVSLTKAYISEDVAIEVFIKLGLVVQK